MSTNPYESPRELSRSARRQAEPLESSRQTRWGLLLYPLFWPLFVICFLPSGPAMHPLFRGILLAITFGAALALKKAVHRFRHFLAIPLWAALLFVFYLICIYMPPRWNHEKHELRPPKVSGYRQVSARVAKRWPNAVDARRFIG